jgi:hypothetical protein
VDVFTAGIALGLLLAVVGVLTWGAGVVAPQLPIGARCGSCAVAARRTGRGTAIAGSLLVAVTVAALLIIQALAAVLGW